MTAQREVTASILEEIGYVVLKAGSGGAALDLLDQHTKIDLMLLDFAMPGMSGVEVARQIHQKAPALPIFVCDWICGQNCARRRRRRKNYQKAIHWRRTHNEGQHCAGQRCPALER